VCEIFFSDFRKKTFSAESQSIITYPQAKQTDPSLIVDPSFVRRIDQSGFIGALYKKYFTLQLSPHSTRFDTATYHRLSLHIGWAPEIRHKRVACPP
jgi:hypothetical protein